MARDTSSSTGRVFIRFKAACIQLQGRRFRRLAARIQILGVSLLLIAAAAAQQSPTPLDPNSITGFENLGTWNVTGSSSPSGFAVNLTTNRMQGKYAYSIANPPNMVKVISQPIASTGTAITGIENPGASVEIDVLLPVQQGNKVNSGYIQAYITSPSRGLSKVPLTQVYFASYRPGVYNTIGFALPDNVTSALNAGSFNDLVFEFDISSPGKMTGAYLLDNLRVHSVELPQSPTGEAPPPGYGGSVNLDAMGNAPDIKSYDLKPTQIPQDFHFTHQFDKASSVLLKLGLDGQPTFTCTYGPDANDATGRNYILGSCTGGFLAGDLVNANWVSLSIVGGNASNEIRAQIGLSPLGDMTGAGLLPPMPTFWGDSDNCMPAPVPGTVVTTSASCSDQANQANQIITNYLAQVQNANPSPNWIVLPVPEFATRRGDGTPTNNVQGGPPPTPGDPLFDDGGDLNPGGSFDAYWRLSGNLSPTVVPNTDENKTHFDGTFTAHGVIFGGDVDVVDAKLTADTDSGQTTPSYVAASSTGTLAFYVFGNEIPSGGLSVNPSTGFTEDLKWSQEYNLPPIQIWIFSITLGATTDAELKAAGSTALSGLDLSLTPSASLGAHVSGGVNLGIASGSVDAKVNLVQVSVPVTAQAKWVINTDPKICAATLNGSLKGDLNVSSGGGELDLDATFGICPLCYTDSETLFKWSALANSDWHLFDDTIDTTLFGLPASMCPFPLTVKIVSPSSGATLSSGLPISLTGSAAPNDPSLAYDSSYTWAYTPGTNASSVTVNSGATGPNPNVTFGAPTSGNTSNWTVGLSGSVTVTAASGTKITENGNATPANITVTNLSNGVYIAQVSSATNGIAIPDSNGILQVGNVPETITVSGVVVGASGTLNTKFEVYQCTNITPQNYPGDGCASAVDLGSLTTSNAATTSPSASWAGFGGGAYKIVMTTTSNGSSFGTTSVVIWGTELL